MKNSNFKRVVSLVLVVMMMITAIPMQVFAFENNETNSGSQSLTEVENKPFEETVLIKQVKTDIARILDKYLGTITMSEEDVKAAVSAMDIDTQDMAFEEISEVIMEAEELTDAELYFLEKYEGTATIVYLFDELYHSLGYDEIALFAASNGTHKPVDGVSVSVSGATDNSMSNGAITVTAQGKNGWLGSLGASSKTATITVYNESGVKATVSFDWTKSSVN